MAIVTHGPFAWHGLINFWVVLSLFFAWIPVFMVYVYRAVGRIEAESARAPAKGSAAIFSAAASR